MTVIIASVLFAEKDRKHCSVKTVISSELRESYTARAPVVVIEHKRSWSRVDVTGQDAMTRSVSRQFTHLAVIFCRISVVQFLAASVQCEAVVHRCTSFMYHH